MLQITVPLPLLPPWQLLLIVFILILSSQQFRSVFGQIVLAYYAITVGGPIAFQGLKALAWTGFYMFFAGFAVVVGLCGFLGFKYFMYGPKVKSTGRRGY